MLWYIVRMARIERHSEVFYVEVRIRQGKEGERLKIGHDIGSKM